MALRQKYGGRKKGSLNKNTSQIKDMILGALDAKGGQKYLERQADDNPVAFMGLIAKVMPTQITGSDDPNAKALKILVEYVTPGAVTE